MSPEPSTSAQGAPYRQLTLIALLIALCFGIIKTRAITDTIYLESLLFIISATALWKSAEVFTRMASAMGTAFGLSPLKTGVLIIAIGTSAPEFFSSFAAALKDQPEMVVGNVLGTIVANCLLAIGVAALVSRYTLNVHRDVSGSQMSVFFAGVILAVGGLYDGQLASFEGALMLLLLVFYLHHTITHAEDEPQLQIDHTTEAISRGIGLPSLFIFLVLSLAALFLSGDYIISSLIEGARLLDFSSAKLATSLLAVGTSIPEIITGIILVKQNNVDGLFGEIIGSNILDILGILGIISLMTTLVIGPALLIFLAVSILLTFTITYVIMHDRRVTRIEGVCMILLYAVFLIQLAEL